MERRYFLQTLAGAAGCLLPFSAGGCSGYRYVAFERVGERLLVRREAYGEGPYALVMDPLRQRAIYLRRAADDSFEAVSLRCTHRGCEVEPVADRLACPCHGSEYTLSGAVIQGPAERSLDRYNVSAEADHIIIELLQADTP